jgi:hypothetical protein
MAAFLPVSAKNAKVRLNGTTYTARKWTVTPTVEELDITNFEGAGYADRIAGIYDAEIMVEADWDSANNNFDNPPSIVVGTILLNVVLYLNDTSGPFWSFPSALITTTPNTADVRGKVELNFTAKTKGTFTYPV